MKTFFDLLNHIKAHSTDENFFSHIKNSAITTISYKKFIENIESLASFLSISGVKKQDKIIIMLDSSPTWLFTDFACIKAGGISIPMFSKLSFENMLFQFHNSEASYIIVQDESIFETIKKTNFPFKMILTANVFSQEFLEKNKEYNIISLEEACKIGFEKLTDTSPFLKNLEKDINENDGVTIIYTSGTSGKPKGVELTHKNLISQIHGINAGFKQIISKDDLAFSFLPLAHIFQRTVTYYFLYKCISLYFSNDLKNIVNDLERTHPSIITIVPRFLEKIKNGLNEKIENEVAGIKKFLARKCFNYALDHKPAKAHNKFLYGIFDKLMYSKLRQKMGGKLKAVICGGAPLSEDIYRFFINCGLPLYQGYGLTETSPVVCVNTPLANKIYTIGKPLPEIEIKLTSESELCVKGPNVMKGYYNSSYEGARIVDEQGFLFTGDLANIDKEGYVKIIGRKKEQFKTSNGKFINPVKIENMLNAIPGIEASCAIAENKPFVTAILFPEENFLGKLPEIETLLPGYIKGVNIQLDHHEHVHYFYLHNKQATIENGILTPSLKLVRTKVEQLFQDIILEFYSK